MKRMYFIISRSCKKKKKTPINLLKISCKMTPLSTYFTVFKKTLKGYNNFLCIYFSILLSNYHLEFYFCLAQPALMKIKRPLPPNKKEKKIKCPPNTLICFLFAIFFFE